MTLQLNNNNNKNNTNIWLTRCFGHSEPCCVSRRSVWPAPHLCSCLLLLVALQAQSEMPQELDALPQQKKRARYDKLATGSSWWRLQPQTLQRWRPPTPPPVCTRQQGLRVHHTRKPGVLCSTSCCWPFPLQCYILRRHCHVCATIFMMEIAVA